MKSGNKYSHRQRQVIFTIGNGVFEVVKCGEVFVFHFTNIDFLLNTIDTCFSIHPLILERISIEE